MKIGDNGGENLVVSSTTKRPRRSSPLTELPNLDQPPAKRELIVHDILDQLRDTHSRDFYRLVAAKVPEHVIRETLSEIKHDPAVKTPPQLFTARMIAYARERNSRNTARSGR